MPANERGTLEEMKDVMVSGSIEQTNAGVPENTQIHTQVGLYKAMIAAINNGYVLSNYPTEEQET